MSMNSPVPLAGSLLLSVGSALLSMHQTEPGHGLVFNEQYGSVQ